MMNYYNHHIGDFAISTQYLTDEELGIYVRLRDHYLSSEKPLQCDWLAVAMRTHCAESVNNVLSLLFQKAGSYWFSPSLDEMIASYQEKTEKASKSAKARWKSSKDAENAMPNGSDLDANAMRTQCDSNANAMLTNNHKPITNNQEKKNTKKKVALVKPDDVTQEVFDEWLDFKKSVSRAKPSQRMIDAIAREADQANISTERAMCIQMENGWQGFKADYIANKVNGNSAPQSFAELDYTKGLIENEDGTYSF